MKNIYYLFIILLLVLLIYVYTEDSCPVEYFEDNQVKCKDNKAINYHSLETPNENIDNSLCIYGDNVICHRPLANNFTEEIYDNNYRCSDKNAYNFEDPEYIVDSKGDQVSVKQSDLIDGKYCGEFVDISSGNIKKVKKCQNVDVCKYIENKTCTYPMSNVKINSLRGITSSNEEFNGLVTSKDINQNNEIIELDELKLMPDNYITLGPHLSNESSELRKNYKKLYTRLFNNDGSMLNNEGLNIWDKNGKIELYQLNIDNNRSDLEYKNYLSNNGKVMDKINYNLSKMPKNYYELVKLFNDRGYQVALAVNDSSTKYAVGIGKTKSEATDVALLRCITFISLEDILDIFSKTFSDKKDTLINVLSAKVDLVKKGDIDAEEGGVLDIIINKVGLGSTELISNPKTTEDLIQKSLKIKSNLSNLDLGGLGKKIIYLTSHADVIRNLKTNLSNEKSDEIKCNIHGKLDTKICLNKPTLNELLQYIYYNCKRENLTDKCGVLLINDKRYVNVNIDKSFLNKCNNCTLSEIKNLCKDREHCNEVAVIGYDNEKCHLYQDIKLSLKDDSYDFTKLPEKDNNSSWINEKDDIIKNDKVDLILENIDKCKKSFEKCVLYKINNKLSSYNSLY